MRRGVNCYFVKLSEFYIQISDQEMSPASLLLTTLAGSDLDSELIINLTIQTRHGWFIFPFLLFAHGHGPKQVEKPPHYAGKRYLSLSVSLHVALHSYPRI